MKTLIMLLLEEQSGLSLHCLFRTICLKTSGHYGTFKTNIFSWLSRRMKINMNVKMCITQTCFTAVKNGSFQVKKVIFSLFLLKT